MPPVTFAVFTALWNNLQGLETPDLHIRMANWLEDEWTGGRRELLLMAFRNSGKSTLVGLFSAWMLWRDPDLRIMVLAADLALARKMVRNVKRIIERHPLTRGLKPTRADQWASEQFTVNRRAELRDPSMLARGIGANLTGSRADVVICDDVEVPNTCDTAPKRADLRARLAEIEYVLVPGGLQLYVGTPHAYDTIYAAQARAGAEDCKPFLSGFERLEMPLLGPGGGSRWPERFPTARIDAIRERSGPNKFRSQMLLEPVNILDSRLDPNRLVAYAHPLDYAERNGTGVLTLGGKRLVSASCWWDPAYGAPGAGDASVVAALFTDQGGTHYLHAIRYLEHDPDEAGRAAAGSSDVDLDEASQQCRQVAEFLRDNHLPSVTLETNGIGRFLPGLLRRALGAAGVEAAVIEATSHRAKDLRILDAFDAVLAAGRLHAHDNVWRTPFIREMREWTPGAICRDDGLDAVAGCLLAEPVRLGRGVPPANGLSRRKPNWRGGGTFTAKTDFTL
ncbi:phage terminase large subunit [Thalassospiraceae bacterium LMO-SO8]|nr:phage terminase large subunit [Alphaproteobacteria bacterium LMO-S08]WND77822.1 phage terminase large subunit [Thalassospiraceae bacterium LMO-SO8]